METQNGTIYVHVIVVPWVSRVYGICTLSVVICIPEGEYTLKTRSTADLYHDSVSQCFPDIWGVH